MTTVDTTPQIQIVLPMWTSRALWAAMHDDDDLAEDYVNLCVIHGLNHLIEQVAMENYCHEQWARLQSNLHQARREACAIEDAMVRRWSEYGETPF